MNSLDKLIKDMENPEFVETIRKQAEEYWAKNRRKEKVSVFKRIR